MSQKCTIVLHNIAKGRLHISPFQKKMYNICLERLFWTNVCAQIFNGFRFCLFGHRSHKPEVLSLKQKYTSSYFLFTDSFLSLWSSKLLLEAMTNPRAWVALILHAVLPLRPLNPIDVSQHSVHRMCHSESRGIDHPSTCIATTPTASNLF